MSKTKNEKQKANGKRKRQAEEVPMERSTAADGPEGQRKLRPPYLPLRLLGLTGTGR